MLKQLISSLLVCVVLSFVGCQKGYQASTDYGYGSSDSEPTKIMTFTDHDPEFGPAMGEAMSYRKKGTFGKAAKMFRRISKEATSEYTIKWAIRYTAYSIEQDPKSSDADLREARGIYSEIIEKNPDYSVTYRQRAEMHRRLGDHDEALADINKAIELNDDEIDAYLVLEERAELYEEMSKPLAAAADWVKAKALKKKAGSDY